VLGARGRGERRAGRARVIEYLALAGVPDPERIGRAYPHELSGGLAQRVVIATSLIREPQVLIADEPTTGLDVTIQLQVLQLLDDLRRRLNLAVVMITHDLGIVTNFCDRVTVMQDGNVVERGTTREVLGNPRERYTVALMEASRLQPSDRAQPVPGSVTR
jgi:ABC-type dipeptide/oligopeptide/nickel transport system ATPase component